MHKVFEYIVEVIGWLRIVASPLLIGLLIGAGIYFTNPTQTRLIIGIIITVIGLLVGIVWATKIWNTKGTSWYVSQTSATPDIDKFMENNYKEEK
jgi:disulfide bond formation protein DsbB